MVTFKNLTELASHVGKPLGETAYLTITQDMVNQFAQATGDHQWIHTDPERATRESPYKTAIAHGYLTLSLAPQLMAELYKVESVKMGINYGANKIRFINAVPVGSRLRMKAMLQQVEPLGTNLKVTMNCIFELEGESKPAGIAELITLLIA